MVLVSLVRAVLPVILMCPVPLFLMSGMMIVIPMPTPAIFSLIMVMVSASAMGRCMIVHCRVFVAGMFLIGPGHF
ncbi:hypothetical protein [Desulfosudis oleivorans]|uniref:hypothetical protein n=1 Tax=Desulfosudis oleivorans TaxID=181663 RepID=UPI0002EE4FA9|nr:hypothetical protein [Desulfosudis oleivorans]